MSDLHSEQPLDIENDGSFEAKGTIYATDGKQTESKKEGLWAIWQHEESAAYVVERLRTDVTRGLTSREANDRLQKHGPNVLTPPLEKPLWRKLLAHFTDFFSLLLQFAAVLCFIAFFTEPSEPMHLYLGVFLYSVVIVTSLFSFVQQYKSDQTLREFRNFLPPQATVVRDGGKIGVVPARDLVVGDIVHIKLGDKIPADVRILHSDRFTVDNSSLTGESEPIELDAEISAADPLEATNLAFFGCSGVDGSCTAVVTATGDATVFGEIARLTSRADEGEVQTTLQRDIHHFVISISVFACAVGVFFFVVGAIRGTRFIHNLVYSIGIIVSNIPEGLLATVTVSLTASARRMARRCILVKQLDAVETLGSTTVICSDKTGTLTQNNMSVSHIAYGGKVEVISSQWKPPCFTDYTACSVVPGEVEGLRSLIHGATLCSTAVFDATDLSQHPQKAISERKVSGDASEAGILRFTEEIHKVEEFRQRHERVATIPFNSKNKYMATVHRCPESELLLRVVVKGAPEIILSRSTSLASKDGVREMTERDRHLLQSQMTYLASRGERVLAYAEQKLSPQRAALILRGDGCKSNVDDIPTTELCFTGLVSLTDPPREGVLQAVRTCKTAGIKVIMVTGDHHDTARSVAQQVGIVTREITYEDSRTTRNRINAVVVKGSDIQNIDEDRWTEILSHEEVVFARTSPLQKLQIVQNLQRMGEVVTVTGDGCNDAAALKQANTGVAMGISGSDVSREAADIVLLDDHFASIVNGVEEGRLIFDNLKKSIAYTLTSNVPQLIPFLAFIALRLPLPLTTVFILSIDLGTDIFPAIALAYEKPETDIMSRPPRDAKKDHLMSTRLVSYSTLQLGFIQTLAGFFAYFVVMSDYGLGPHSLVGLSAGAHFGAERITDQRWLVANQEKISGQAHDASWFSRESPLFSRYFQATQPGFLIQKEDQLSLLLPHESGKEGRSGKIANKQFQNMMKIIAHNKKQPPCMAFSCTLDANRGVTTENDIACFNTTHNSGPVTLLGVGNEKGNTKVVPGTDEWQGCFSIWTPQREREVLRRAQTAFFAAVVVAQIFTLLACKTRILSIFSVGIGNSAILLSLVLELCISFMIVYLPLLRAGFGARPLRLIHWLPGVPFGIFIIAYDECRKWFIRSHIRNESGHILAEDGIKDKLARWVHDYTLW